MDRKNEVGDGPASGKAGRGVTGGRVSGPRGEGEAGPPGVCPRALTRGTEGCLMHGDITSVEHKGAFVLCPETKLEHSHKG